MRQPSREPDWAKWRHIPEAELWQAVGLSLNIEPNKVRFNPNGWMAQTVLFEEGPEFDARLQIAEANLGQSKPLVPKTIIAGKPRLCKVSLPDFARWWLSLKSFSAPPEFAELASAGAQSENGPRGRWPWGNYETPLLKDLAAAAEKWWRNYDSSDHTTAPTNEDVKNWLVNERKVSDRVAAVMAQILRDPDIRTGPR